MDIPPLFIYCLQSKIGRIVLPNDRTVGNFNGRKHMFVQSKLNWQWMGIRPQWGGGQGCSYCQDSIRNFHLRLRNRTTLPDFKSLNAKSFV